MTATFQTIYNNDSTIRCYTEWNEILTLTLHRDSLLQKIWKLLYNICPEMFSFRETCHRQMVHALIVGPKHGLETCVPRVVVCIQLIVKKYLEDLRLG